MKPDEKSLFNAVQEQQRSEDATVDLVAISESLAIPYKRARYLTRKWSDKDLYEWGVSWRWGWLTTAGKALAIG